MVYPNPKRATMVKTIGFPDALAPLKYRALIPPPAEATAGPLGNFE